MARYRKIDVRIWNDGKFSAFQDDSKLAFLFLLTHPNLTSLGAMRATRAGLAEELGWAVPRFSRAFDAIVTAGMAQFDARASFLWLPKFLRYNQPESPNVVKGWAKAMDLLPECELRSVCLSSAGRSLQALPDSFGKVFAEVFRQVFEKTHPKTRPNQEQEQLTDQDPTPDDDNPGGGSSAPRSGDVVSSTVSTANRGGTEQLAVLELVTLWNRTRTTANTVVMPMGPKAYRPLVDAVRRRSLDAWEATFRRVEASDYLAGRADLPGLTLWDAIDRAERIDSGQYDNRPSLAEREQQARQAVVQQALDNLAAQRAGRDAAAPTPIEVPSRPEPERRVLTLAKPEAIAAALRPLQRRLRGAS